MNEPRTDTEAPAHVAGERKGEEAKEREGQEPGRYDTGNDSTPAGRPHGTSTARDYSGVDPQEPIDSESPISG
jgi:hypothetical protein